MMEILLQEIDCPLCGCRESTRVFSGMDRLCGLPGVFSVVRCRSCGHEFMNPQPVPECLAACYPSDYSPHLTAAEADLLPQNAGTDVSGAGLQRPWYLRYLPLRYVPGLRALYYWLTDDRGQPLPAPSATDLANSPETLRALELGCATGRYLQALKRSGWDVQGVELCEQPAAMAREAGLKVHQGTLESAALPAGTFHLVAAWMVIEHVPEPRQTLAELNKLMRPEGQILLSIPNARCWQRFLFGKAWYCWDLPRHLQHFSPASIRRVLEDSGFHQIEVIHQRTLLSLMGSIGMVILSLIPRNRMGTWFLRYPEQPRLTIQLLLAPLAILLSVLRQGERLTVRAHKLRCQSS